jgi:sortase A
MRLVVAQGPLRLILKWTQRALFAAAALMFCYCAFVLTDTWIFQRREQRRLDRMLTDRRETPIATAVAPKASPSAITDGLIGRINIARLGLSAIVMEGDDRITLRRAVGHIPGTTLPGKPGNVGVAGHRDTFFRPLRNIQQHDVITLTTAVGEYRYRVVSTKVVSPRDIWVLNPGGDEILTLVTCYPFYFVGSAPDRFIVRAERIFQGNL